MTWHQLVVTRSTRNLNIKNRLLNQQSQNHCRCWNRRNPCEADRWRATSSTAIFRTFDGFEQDCLLHSKWFSSLDRTSRSKLWRSTDPERVVTIIGNAHRRWVPSPSRYPAEMSYFLNLADTGRVDGYDHLGNRRIRAVVGELLKQLRRLWLSRMERVVPWTHVCSR